jgi:hypothetical protein
MFKIVNCLKFNAGTLKKLQVTAVATKESFKVTSGTDSNTF